MESISQLLTKLVFLSLILISPSKTFYADNTHKPVRISLITEINHPYVYYKKNSKELTGMAVDIVNELLKRANINMTKEVEVLPWLRAIKKLNKNDNTCLFIMNRTAKRELKYTWIGPMILGHLALYKRPDSDITINSISDLSQYTVIGKINGMAIQDLQKDVNFKVLTTSSDEQSAALLFRKRGDLWATGDIDGPLAIKELNLPMPTLIFKRAPTDLSMGCSLNLPPVILDALTAAHDSMAEYRKAIFDKYLSTPN